MRRNRVMFLLPVVLVAGSAVFATSPAQAAVEPPSKAAKTSAKLPAAVLHAVQGGGGSAGFLAEGSVRSDPAGRIQLDFHAAGPTGPAEEADLLRLGADGVRSRTCRPTSRSPRA